MYKTRKDSTSNPDVLCIACSAILCIIMQCFKKSLRASITVSLLRSYYYYQRRLKQDAFLEMVQNIKNLSLKEQFFFLQKKSMFDFVKKSTLT